MLKLDHGRDKKLITNNSARWRPVSYTHLDVYKRQTFNKRFADTRTGILPENTLFGT